MKNRVLLALALLSSACSEGNLPGIPGARYSAGPSGHCPAEVAFAVSTFVVTWADRYPDTVMPDHVRTMHFETVETAWFRGEALVRGETLSRQHIRYALRGAVMQPEVQSIATTALIHELVHAALWVDTGDPDAAHKTPEFRDLLDVVEARIRAAADALDLCTP